MREQRGRVGGVHIQILALNRSLSSLKVSVTVKVCFLIKCANLLKLVEGLALMSEF